VVLAKACAHSFSQREPALALQRRWRGGWLRRRWAMTLAVRIISLVMLVSLLGCASQIVQTSQPVEKTQEEQTKNRRCQLSPIALDFRCAVASQLRSSSVTFGFAGTLTAIYRYASRNVAPRLHPTFRHCPSGGVNASSCIGVDPSWAADPSIGNRMINARAKR
jgi:hypothetical protein